MAEHEIIWHGISSSELGIHIISEPNYDISSPSVTSNHILGKNGDILTETYDFANSSRQYRMAFELYGKSFGERCAEVMNWLCGEYMTDGAHTYSELYDTYDKDIYYLAAFVPGGEFEKTMASNTVVGSYLATFNRRPERFYVSGNERTYADAIPSSTSSSEFLSFPNQTQFASKPSFYLGHIPANTRAAISIDHFGSSAYNLYDYRIEIINESSSEGSILHDPYRSVFSVSEDLTYKILCQNPSPFDQTNYDDDPSTWFEGELLFWPGDNTVHSVPYSDGDTAVSGISCWIAPHWWRL